MNVCKIDPALVAELDDGTRDFYPYPLPEGTTHVDTGMIGADGKPVSPIELKPGVREYLVITPSALKRIMENPEPVEK